MSPSPSRLARARAVYVTAAVMLLNTILLGGVVAGLWFAGKGIVRHLARARQVSAVEQVYGERIFDGYPDQPRAEVRELLRETWSRRYAYEPFTMFKERPFGGIYVNVAEAGFRRGGESAPWPPSPDDTVVFVLGGSTTFGYGVKDGETIPSRLEAFLRDAGVVSPRVYNFGRGYYFSSQELVLFSRLLAAGKGPQVAVFIDGLNDSLRPEGRPEFGDRFEELFAGPDEHGEDAGTAAPSGPETVTAIIERYLQNARQIRALAADRGIETLFLWQPVHFHHTPAEQQLFPDDERTDYGLAAKVYEAMAGRQSELEAEGWFVWGADWQEGTSGLLFVDNVHYNARFSDRIARQLGWELLDRGWLSGGQ